MRTGPVVRGLVAWPQGPRGTPTGRACDFGREEIDGAGRIVEADVQCGPGATVEQLSAGLSARFIAYCAVDASQLAGARLVPVPRRGDPHACWLSGLTIGQARERFGEAVWR